MVMLYGNVNKNCMKLILGVLCKIVFHLILE